MSEGVRHIRVKHKWSDRGDEHRLLTNFTAPQMEQLRDLQSLLKNHHGYNVSLSVFIRAGLLSLVSLIKRELERDPVNGLAVVVAMLERAASKDTITLH